MMKEILRILFIASFSFCTQGYITDTESCEDIMKQGRSTHLVVKSRKKESDDWQTNFQAWRMTESGTTEMEVKINQSILSCGGREVIYLQGVINGDSENITFHSVCGSNVAISNNGRTARKIKLDEETNGVLFTSRPLKNNELFEVRLEQKNPSHTWSPGIGVTTHPPGSITVPKYMADHKSGNWMYYTRIVNKDGDNIMTEYGFELQKLKVGDRIGVLRNNFGALHFYVNGVDQGPVASNVPYPVWGVYDLCYLADIVTIVKP